jgi:hypothetical protein
MLAKRCNKYGSENDPLILGSNIFTLRFVSSTLTLKSVFIKDQTTFVLNNIESLIICILKGYLVFYKHTFQC